MRNILVLLTILLMVGACSDKKTETYKTVKVMTYNIRYDNPYDSLNNWDKRKALVTQIIKTESPDIIGIQEALRHQIDDLITMLPDYYWIGVGRDDGKDGGEFSPILYNKHRFKKYDSNTFWLSETPDTVSRGWDAACNRVCSYVKLRDLNTENIILVFNTHFDHEGKEAQLNSAKLITRRIHQDSQDFPFVLTGDFNVNLNSEPYKIIGKTVEYFKIVDSKIKSETKHIGSKTTFNGFDLNYANIEAIDHIFVRNETRVLNHKTIDTLIKNRFPSDHFPVVTELEFKKAL